MRTQLPTALLASALACAFIAAPAQAQVPRTFVSAAGSDSNTCANVTTPCRHFAAAYAATAPSGEIFVLDPANYGSLTITHSVSIEGHGWASIAPPNGGNAVTITAGSRDSVSIHGVAINGTGATGGTNGIVFNSGAELQVVNCVVSNFAGNGIGFTPTVSSTLVVSNTLITGNVGGFAGVFIAPKAANLTLRAVLNRVELHKNSTGLFVFDSDSTGGTIDVSAVDTVASNNAAIGFHVETLSVSSPVTHVSLVRASAVENGSAGVFSSGPQSTMRLAQSLIAGNDGGWGIDNGSLLLSYGNNFIDGNNSHDETAPSPIPQK